MRLTYKAGLSLSLIGVLLAGMLGGAHAQDSTGEDRLTASKRNLMVFAANNARFDQRVESEARILFRRQFPECTNVDQLVRQLPVPYGILVFQENKDNTFPPPRTGLWAEHVKMRGCNKIWQINMLAVARNDATQPMLLALLPGDTLADPSAQRGAERIGATAIRKSDASCSDDARARNTRMLGFKQADGSVGKTDVKEGWFEEWTYDFCQKQVPAQLAFIPDGSGGYDIKARMIGAAAPVAPAQKPATPAQTPAAQTPATQSEAAAPKPDTAAPKQ